MVPVVSGNAGACNFGMPITVVIGSKSYIMLDGDNGAGHLGTSAVKVARRDGANDGGASSIMVR